MIDACVSCGESLGDAPGIKWVLCMRAEVDYVAPTHCAPCFIESLVGKLHAAAEEIARLNAEDARAAEDA